MTAETLIPLVTLLVSLSMAAERLVEIVRGAVPWLSTENPDPALDARRKMVLQLLAVLAGILTVTLAGSGLLRAFSLPDQAGSYFVLGLLTSGGSGLWNTILSYLIQIKNIRRNEAEQKTMLTRRMRRQSDAST